MQGCRDGPGGLAQVGVLARRVRLGRQHIQQRYRHLAQRDGNFGERLDDNRCTAGCQCLDAVLASEHLAGHIGGPCL